MSLLRPYRRLPMGAEPILDGVDFRVWAPRRRRVAVVVEDEAGGEAVGEFNLSKESHGYFSGRVPSIGSGAFYRYRLAGDDALYPDPASRFQPAGPHGPSQVIDPTTFE
jgi:maltooligosyltrehalose trehalohydrolase